MKSDYVEINGHKVHFVCFGNGDDMVFLHGWGASISAFLFVAKSFARNHRVTLLDFAGFGASEEPSETYDVEKYCDDVVRLLEHLSIKRAVFVGHSFGGRVCLQLAATHGDAVEKLALVDSAGIKPRRGLKYYIRVGLHKALKRLGLRGLRGSQDYRKLSPHMRETFKRVVNYDQSGLLNKIECPTAVFWGNKDRETPLYMAKKIKKGIADSEIFLLDGGHFAYADDAKRFLAILHAFAD